MSKTIHLGYEAVSGLSIDIPLHHMVVTGQTQLSGKTTTLEALMSRVDNMASLAFKTKRGEASFANAMTIAPYFRERADWRFVQSVLEATLSQKLKFETAWIMRACKGAETLGQVHSNVKQFLTTAKGLNENVYLTLDHFLEIVVPRIANVQFDHDVNMHGGVNVMDLQDGDTFPFEMQSLVMSSTIDWIYKHSKRTITVIPEAWEFLPQERNSPVKLSLEKLIRKGANLDNYVWLDSQDIAGVDKTMLRQCQVWLIGVQREANEIKRVLDNIPAGIEKPKASDIQTLEKGHFYACFGRYVHKVYVQPSWMLNETAIKIATGKTPVSDIRGSLERPADYQHSKRKIIEIEALPKTNRPPINFIIPPPKQIEEEPMSKAIEEKLDGLASVLEKFVKQGVKANEVSRPAPLTPTTDFDEESLYARFLNRLINDQPTILRLIGTKNRIELDNEIVTIEMKATTLIGRLAKLIHGGFFESPKTASAAYTELKRIGHNHDKRGVYRECDKLAEMGFLTKEKDGFLCNAEMKRNIVKS